MPWKDPHEVKDSEGPPRLCRPARDSPLGLFRLPSCPKSPWPVCSG